MLIASRRVEKHEVGVFSTGLTFYEASRASYCQVWEDEGLKLAIYGDVAKSGM